jgi:hypothetical protein
MQNHMASFLPEESIADFRKSLNGLAAGNISECAHGIFNKLYGHEMGAVCFLRDFEVFFFGRLKIACDGFADIGHSFGHGFALRHASGKAGTFGNIAVVFGIVNELDFKFHNAFLFGESIPFRSLIVNNFVPDICA